MCVCGGGTLCTITCPLSFLAPLPTSFAGATVKHKSRGVRNALTSFKCKFNYPNPSPRWRAREKSKSGFSTRGTLAPGDIWPCLESQLVGWGEQ